MTTTIQQHLKKLKPAHRDAALTNMKPSGMTEHASDIGSAIAVAFDWVEAPEGYTFWSDICHELIRGEYSFTEEESKERETGLPVESKERKTYPIYSGLIAYFADALAAVANLSYKGNQQHHADEPLHWDKSKSTDSRDALMRHVIDMEKANKDGDYEKELEEAKRVAWRGLENLQRLIEGSCQYTNNKLDK